MGCLASADLPKFCLTYQNIYEKPSFPCARLSCIAVKHMLD